MRVISQNNKNRIIQEVLNKEKLNCHQQLNAILVKKAVIYTTNLRAIYWGNA